MNEKGRGIHKKHSKPIQLYMYGKNHWGESSEVYINKCIDWCVLTVKRVHYPNYALTIHISKFTAPSSPFKDG